MKFAERLKTMRHLHNYTQQQLAKALGVSPATISLWESGDRVPPLPTLESIADTFNIPMSNLIGDDEMPADEFDGLLESLKAREEGRMLFRALKGATTEDILKTVQILDMFKKKNG